LQFGSTMNASWPLLATYLQDAARAGPYRIGQADCLMLVADWVSIKRGVDPAAFCRGYDEPAAAALVSCWGPLPRAMGRVLRCAGVAMTAHPKPGDIAAIALDGLAHCAIRTTRGWVTRLQPGGLTSLPDSRVRVVAAWSV
jgi:hypothetical protein